jgi:hypothetical protein
MFNRFRYILLFSLLQLTGLKIAAQLAMPDNVCTGSVKHYYVDPNPVPGSQYRWRVNGIVQSSVTNEIYITWSVPGTFELDVQETSVDGCPGPLRSGQIFVSSVPGSPGPITGPAAFIPGTTGVTYSVGDIPGASNYNWSYTGTGVTINGSGTNVTLDFSSAATAGELKVNGVNSCGSGAEKSLSISLDTRTLNLSGVLLQGLYNGGGKMREASNESGPKWGAGVADHITVELHSPSNYSNILYTATDVPLSISGSCSISIPGTFGSSYYITIRHRNSLETTTYSPVSFAGSTISQSFGTPADVYGSNLGVSSDGRYLIYAGDVNQDGSVDSRDYIGVDNDSYNYATGYLVTDVDGNGVIDTRDYIFIDNNNYNYVGTIHP